MQKMMWILSALEQDSDRQPLHDFHVVASRILGRQKAEAIAAGTGHVFDVTAVVSTEGIDVDRDPFAMMHPGQLRFFEIRRHPDFVGFGSEHQGRYRL